MITLDLLEKRTVTCCECDLDKAGLGYALVSSRSSKLTERLEENKCKGRVNRS